MSFFQVLNLHSCVKVAEDFVSPEVRRLPFVFSIEQEQTLTYFLAGVKCLKSYFWFKMAWLPKMLVRNCWVICPGGVVSEMFPGSSSLYREIENCLSYLVWRVNFLKYRLIQKNICTFENWYRKSHADNL